MDELKPCPFCGGRASAKKNYGGKDTFYETYVVYCMNEDCKVEPITHRYFNKAEAIEAWNRRAEDGK